MKNNKRNVRNLQSSLFTVNPRVHNAWRGFNAQEVCGAHHSRTGRSTAQRRYDSPPILTDYCGQNSNKHTNGTMISTHSDSTWAKLIWRRRAGKKHSNRSSEKCPHLWRDQTAETLHRFANAWWKTSRGDERFLDKGLFLLFLLWVFIRGVTNNIDGRVKQQYLCLEFRRKMQETAKE